MKFLISLLSSDDDEFILTEHKKGRTKIKNYIEEVVRKMSDEIVSLQVKLKTIVI